MKARRDFFARWRRISAILLPKCILEIDITIIPSHSVGTLGHTLDTFDYGTHRIGFAHQKIENATEIHRADCHPIFRADSVNGIRL
jgi:hypothetical protein